MSAERFRLAIFVVIVMTLAAGAGVGMWAVQWRYVTTTEGGLLRFNRFTGAEEIYACRGGRIAVGLLYIRPNEDCYWVPRGEGGAEATSWWANVPAPAQWGIVGVVLAVGVLALSHARSARSGPAKKNAPNGTSTLRNPH